MAVETGDGWVSLPVSEFEALHAEVERLTEALSMATGEPGPWLRRLIAERADARTAHALARAALQDAVASTGGALIVQDYGRLNLALLGKPDADE